MCQPVGQLDTHLFSRSSKQKVAFIKLGVKGSDSPYWSSSRHTCTRWVKQNSMVPCLIIIAFGKMSGGGHICSGFESDFGCKILGGRFLVALEILRHNHSLLVLGSCVSARNMRVRWVTMFWKACKQILERPGWERSKKSQFCLICKHGSTSLSLD